jgi:hypothetical protein
MEPKIFFPADGWFAARQRTMALEFYALGRGEEAHKLSADLEDEFCRIWA